MKRILAFLLPALAAHAQYTGKVGGAAPKPILRALAVYEYTGALAKPNASRLVPIAVWDGKIYQPGSLYLARPEPLAVAPGTQYVLEKTGEPQGFFNISSAAKLGTGGWVGLGRFQAEAPQPPPAKLKPSKQLPALSGGSGKGKAEPDADPPSENRPTLHRKTDSNSAPETSPTPDKNGGPALHRRDADPSATPDADPDKPTLHRKDSGDVGQAPAPDPDRPTLHRADASGGQQQPDADRPILHRHADAPATVSAPDPDRPHLRYGAASEEEGRVAPALLEGKPGAPLVPVADAIAVSDTAPDDPHPYSYAWPTPQAKADAETAMHGLALRALASAAQAAFGPAAKADADALRRAADAAQASFGPGAKTAGRRRAVPATAADPLTDAQLTALELSYGNGATYVYTAHTTPEGPARRYVTVIAKPDFNGKPQVILTQATRGDQLDQTPALRLVDAVDANGDNRAELLFSLVTPGTLADPQAARQFALYGIGNGRAELLYTSEPAGL